MSLNPETVFEFVLMNHSIAVTSSIVKQWIIMAIIIVVTFLLTRKIDKIPSKKQTVLEILVTMFSGLVTANMGKGYLKFFLPYVGTLGIFMACLNLSGLVGVAPSTKDINVTLTFALITFVLINANAIRELKLSGYLKGYLKPYAPMLPLNIIEKLTIPLSLCLRLFINMLVGVMIMELVYEGLKHFAFVIPVPLHFFFDGFVAIIQTYVFMMLTMVYTKNAVEH